MQPGNPIVGGVALRRPAIQSPNFQTQVLGWSINQDGSAEFNNAQIRGSLLIGGSSPAAREVIGGTIPTELVTYYNTGVTGVTPTAPETVVALLEQSFDGNGNYGYRVLLVDSSATKVTSIAFGATVSSVVTEAGRFVVNPGATLGGGRYETFTERMITILTDPTSGTTLLSTRHPGDAFDVWSINVLGTMGWGDGTALTDVYVARNASNSGLEIGSSWRMRGFGAATDNALIVLLDGEAHERFFTRFDGYMGWGPGSAVWDTDLFRNGAGQLATASRFLIGSSAKDVAASCAGINNATGAGTTTSSTYVNVPATSSFSFVKQFTATRIKIEFDITNFSTVASTNEKFGILINGVDTDIAAFAFNEANSHRQVSGTAYMASGLAAGTYTIQARWKRTSGTGTLTTDANDWISLSAMEVSA